MKNDIYRIAGTSESISVKDDFKANLFDKKLGRNFAKHFLDEAQFIYYYEKLIFGLLAETPKLQANREDLTAAYLNMQQALTALS